MTERLKVGLTLTGAGFTSALCVLSLLTFHPLAFLCLSLAPLPLYYVSFSYHPQWGSVVGSLVTAILSLFLGWVGLLYGLMIAGPVIVLWAFRSYFLVNNPQPQLCFERLIQGHVIYFMGVLFLIFFMGYDLFTASSHDMNHMIHDQFHLKNVIKQSDLHVIVSLVYYIPGMVALWGSFLVYFNGGLAVNILKKQHKPLPPFRPLSTFNLSFKWWIYFVITAAVALMGSSIGAGGLAKNGILLLFSPFLLQGLGVVSVLLGQDKNESFTLLIIAGLSFIFNLFLLIIVFMGLLEPWIKIRQKIIVHRRNK